MKAIIPPLDRAPATLLLLLAIVSIQLGSALAIDGGGLDRDPSHLVRLDRPVAHG